MQNLYKQLSINLIQSGKCHCNYRARGQGIKSHLHQGTAFEGGIGIGGHDHR